MPRGPKCGVLPTTRSMGASRGVLQRWHVVCCVCPMAHPMENTVTYSMVSWCIPQVAPCGKLSVVCPTARPMARPTMLCGTNYPMACPIGLPGFSLWHSPYCILGSISFMTLSCAVSRGTFYGLVVWWCHGVQYWASDTWCIPLCTTYIWC